MASMSFAYVSAMQAEPRWRRSSASTTSDLKTLTIKRLRRGFHGHLPLNVRVASVTQVDVPDRHAVYHLTVASAVSHRSWVVSYRYAEFCAFREAIETEWTCADDHCAGACSALRECCRACFPRKRWLSSTSERAVDDRKHKLESFLLHLIRTIMLPGNAMQCPVARRLLPTQVYRFLHVTSPTDQRTALQMYVENLQPELTDNVFLCPESETPGRLSMASTASTVSNEDATTTTEMEKEPTPRKQYCCEHKSDATIVLPCHHAFHRSCILAWLEAEFRCPLCHASVGPKTTTTLCCPRNQVQWWLGSFRDYAVPRAHH